jgi:ParB/RepB/Spo0J family partition protein
MQLELHELELRYEAIRIAEPARRARLLASLEAQGQQSPVMVVPAGAPPYVLIDGYARVEALRRLGIDLVEAMVLDVPQPDALILAHRLETKRQRSALEEGWLIEALLEHGLNQAAVATRLQRSVSWVSRRLALVQALPETAQLAVRRGIIPAYAAMKYLVPLARAKREHCERLVAGLGDEQISVREMERLYLGWKRSDDVTRERIVTQPRLFLRAEAATRREPLAPKDDPSRPLLEDLETLAGASQRGRRRLREGLCHALDAQRLAVVQRAMNEAQLACASLFDLLKEELG